MAMARSVAVADANGCAFGRFVGAKNGQSDAVVHGASQWGMLAGRNGVTQVLHGLVARIFGCSL